MSANPISFILTTITACQARLYFTIPYRVSPTCNTVFYDDIQLCMVWHKFCEGRTWKGKLASRHERLYGVGIWRLHVEVGHWLKTVLLKKSCVFCLLLYLYFHVGKAERQRSAYVLFGRIQFEKVMKWDDYRIFGKRLCELLRKQRWTCSGLSQFVIYCLSTTLAEIED